MTKSISRALLTFAAPVAVLITAVMFAPRLAAPSPSLSGIKAYGPSVVLALGGLISLWFNRGRTFFSLVSLAAAYLSFTLLPGSGSAALSGRGVFAAACIFVPVNLALFSLLPERGILNRRGLMRLMLIAGEVLFTAVVVLARVNEVTDWLYQNFLDGVQLGTSRVPQSGLLVMAASLVPVVVKALVRRSPIDSGIAGAIIAFAIACFSFAAPGGFPAFVSAAGLMLLISVLQDSYRMAFRDELTGLPSRRALNERMMGLGHSYAIAMLDVDHFKKFNDTHGHAVGDQVLKMVAAQIAHVGGGGKPFRFGGEEFTVLFPGKSIKDAIPHLEELRERIARYALAIRGTRRSAGSKASRSRRTSRAERSASVTISIGVAEKGGKLNTPGEVIKAADKALYRAKNKGRNQVSR